MLGLNAASLIAIAVANVTSPPYLNAIDYMRCSKFSLVWMGYNVEELRRIRGESVGAECTSETASKEEWVRSLLAHLKLQPALSARDQGMLARYAWDMDRLSERCLGCSELGPGRYMWSATR